MKPILTLVAAAVLTASLGAQPTTQPAPNPDQSKAEALAAAVQAQAEYAKRRTEKLAKPVFHGEAKWEFDYDAARQLAATENKFVLVYFTRSHAP